MPVAMASSISSEFRIRKHCFNVPDRIEADLHGHGEPVNLGEHEAKSFAKLLPLLGCGEEAAALAFDGLAICYRDDDVIATSLKLIAYEERVHEAILGRLSRSLPPAPMQTQLIDKAQRLHVGLTRGGTNFHLARIAALDSVRYAAGLGSVYRQFFPADLLDQGGARRFASGPGHARGAGVRHPDAGLHRRRPRPRAARASAEV